MRLILFVTIVGLLSVTALTVRPRVGIYGYIWYSLMRPDQFAYIDYANYYSTVLAACTIIGSLRLVIPNVGTLFRSKLAVGLIALLLISGISAVAAVSQPLALDAYWDHLKVMAVLLLIPVVLETPEHLRMAVIVAAGSIGFVGLKFGAWSSIHGGARLVTGLVNDNNFLALLLAVGVPLCWYGAAMVPRKWFRLVLYGMMFFSIVAVVASYSRGGTIALGFALLIIALRSRQKVLIIALLVICSLPALYLGGDAYLRRMSTVTDPMAERSAASRIYLMKIGLRIWRDYPILGVGFGRTNQQMLMQLYFPEVVENKAYAIKVVHNTYIQMLTDCGLVGFLPFIAVLFGAVISLGRSAHRTAPPWKGIPWALQTSLITFAVGGMTISALPSFDAFYILIALAACWQIVGKSVEVEPARGRAVVVLPQGAPAFSH
jgi:probable O-glycosylation ligase (exosortase A-associated)